MRSDLERNLKKFQQNTPQATPAAALASYPATFAEYRAQRNAQQSTYPATFAEYRAQREAQAVMPQTSTYPSSFAEYRKQREEQKQEDEQRRREEERQKCLEASGFTQMQSDMNTMFGGMDAYLSQTKRKDVGQGRLQQVQGMLEAVEKEKDYFNRYADVLGDAADYQAALEQWEQQLKGYEAALGRKRTLTPEQTPQELLTDNPLTGKKLGAALTGLQNPLTPVDTNEDGQPDTLQVGYTLGNRRLTQRGEALSGQLQQKAKRADWNNQTVQEHEKYIRQSFEELEKFTQNGTSQEAAENIHAGIFREIAERLNYLAMSGKCTEEEYEKLVDEVNRLKKEYQEKADRAYRNYPNKWTGDAQGAIRNAANSLPDKGTAMKEFRYQNSNLTRENIAYQPVDKLLDRMHFTYSKDEGWGSSSAERAAITFMGEEVLPEYLANTEMTQEQYNRFLQQIKGTPNEAALRRVRESNGLNANEEGKKAALEKYREIDGQTYMNMFESGSEGAMHNVMEKYPGGAEQVLTRGLGYITKFTGRALNMFGENAVGNWFKEGGQKGIDYVNEDWQAGKQREYEEGRYTSDLLQNGSKFEKWTAGMTRDLTQAALEMAAAGAIAGQISAGNTALAQLSQGGKYASSLANAQKQATGYMKFTAQMAELMKNSSNVLISANAALNSYGEAEDAGMDAGGRAIKLIAGGLIEYYSNGLFSGNPVVDPDGAGEVVKKIYELTDNETIRKIVSSKVFDLIGEGLEEVVSAIAGAALDYALTGETSLSGEELLNEFTVGVLLSMVMSAPEDVVDALARAKNSVQSRVITKFGKDAQTNLETLYGTMVNYTMKDLAGDESMMRLAGWSDSQIKKAKSEWQTAVREFNTLANRLEGNQSISDSFTPYTPPEGYANNAFEDVEYMNAIRANQASDAALMTDRALDIATIQQRMQIESLRNSTDAGDIFQAENAQSYLDILDRERSYRQAERAKTAQEAAEWNAAGTTRATAETAQEAPQAAQESANNETAPVEPAQENEGGEGNESNGQSEERAARVDSAGEAVAVEGKPERANDTGAGEGRTGNLSEAARRGKLEERIKRFSEVAQDKPVSELMSNGDPDALVGVVPVRKYTKEMQKMQRAVKSHGLKLTYVKGTLSIQAQNGEYINANGAYDEETGRIFASVSSAGYEPEQIAQHELYHALIAKGEANVEHTLQLLRNEYSDEQLMEIAREYEKLYFGVYDSGADVWEEIFADAYSGMNRFGTGKIFRLQRTVAESTPEVDVSAPAAEISDATRRTQDSDGNKKTARKGGKMSAEQYSYQGKSMTENSEIYSYDFLTHQPDMKVAELPALSEVQTDGRIDRTRAVEMGMQNLQEYGRRLDKTTATVKNVYTGRDIIVAKAALTHGLDGANISRLRTNARISSAAGEIIANAVPVNALKNESKNAIGTYAMVAIADSDGTPIVAVVTVEQYTNNVLAINAHEIKDQAHALNGRIAKKGGSLSSKDHGYSENEAPNAAASTQSIADVLRVVNTTHQSILSDDVLKTLGETRNPEGYYAPRVKFSTKQQLDEEYMMAVRTGDTGKAQKMVETAAKKAGYTIHAYHGTARADRVGTEFREDRATSGPMAFFTDSKEIAGNYARDKADTSLAYDEEYADYSTQFRVKKNGKSISVTELWNTLPMRERMRIREAGKHITFDDEAENIIYDPEAEYGVGAYDAYTLNQHGGNAIAALVSNWLEDGNLYNEESKFLDVLRLAGIEGVEYKDPDARQEKVYDVFLKIKNPFDTATVDMAFLTDFESWYEQQDEAKYQRENMQADMWDKNGMTGMEWAEEHLRDDIENGTNYSWVTIPDAVTDYLKSKGYDGIKDVGGKGGGEGHTVWIPFTGTQVKSAETEVYSDDGELIPLSQRFKPKKRDIRFSLAENENLTTIRNLKEDDLEALYGAARIPVKELLTDTEGEGEVSLIVKNEDARNNKAHLEHMAAVIPTSADGWLVEKLKMNGLNVVVYESGNEAARQEAETKAEKLLEEPTTKFSLSPEEKVQRAEEKLTAAQEKLEKEQAAAQKRYKSDLTGGLKRLFNIQSYDNEKLNALLETPMQMMQQNVNLLSTEKADLFEALMDLGTETIPADDYYKDIRADLKERKIYVPESVRAEFGDDWQDFYKRAFGRHKIYLTKNEADRGADVHMQELAGMYPGTFTETTDTAEMLRQMVDAADKGMDAKLSWREAAKENEKRYGLKQTDQIEYQKANFLNLLNAYAEKAGKTAREAQATTETDERLASIIREADGEKASAKKAEGPVEPWTISEAAAQKRGFPNLNGRQVYPLRTWVKAADMGNYGLVLDKSTKKGKLTVLFQNKETGLASVKDIDTKDLTAVDATYQPSVQETASLLASLPAETLEDAADAQDVAEFYEWYDGRARLADAEEKARTRAAAEQERKDSIVREEEKAEARKQERLEGVRKAYLESFGTSEPELPYGKGKPFFGANTTLTPPEAVELLQAATGKVWEVRETKGGTWKAVQKKETAPKSNISAESAAKKLESAKRTLFNHPAFKGVHAEGIDKRNFKGSPAMEKLGIKLAGSIADFEMVKELRRGAESRRALDWQIEKMESGLSEEEQNFAQEIAYGRKTIHKLPEKMEGNWKRIEKLADLYVAERMQGDDLVRMRSRAVRGAALLECTTLFPTEADIIEAKMTDKVELVHPESLLVMNYRTPDRVLRGMFGEEVGGKIYQYLIDGVKQNEAEKMRCLNNLFDSVREFEGEDGKKRKLTATEDKYVDIILDTEGYRWRAEHDKQKDDIISAADRIAKGVDTRDAQREFGLSSEQAETAEMYARWLNRDKLGKVDLKKVDAAVKAYKELFADVFEAINDVLVSFGYEPIGKVFGYSPHMSIDERFNIVDRALQEFGIHIVPEAEKITTLPAALAGRTQMFKPRKRYVPYFETRTGIKTEYGIRRKTQVYLNYALDMIFHISDLTKLRAAESYLATGLEGNFDLDIQKAIQMSITSDQEGKIRWLQRVGAIPKEQTAFAKEEVDMAFDNLLQKLLKERTNVTRYSDLKQWVTNYTNILAGKQYGGDRGLEYRGGRGVMDVGNKITRMFAVATVAGNITSAFNQIAQIELIAKMRSRRAIAEAFAALGSGAFGKGPMRDFQYEVDFLTGKKGVNMLIEGKGDKILGGMFFLAEMADTGLSFVAAYSAYLDAVYNGKDHYAAIQYADWFSRAVMGDRMKGSKPNAFHTKSAFWSSVQMYQLENLNTVDFVLTDVPKEIQRIAKEHGKAKAMRALLRLIVGYLFGAFILNRLTDEIYGGTPVPFDIAGITSNFLASGEGLSANDYIKSLVNKVSQAIAGEDIFDDLPERNEEFDWESAKKTGLSDLTDEVPMLSNIMGWLGIGDKSRPIPDFGGTIEDIKKARKSSGVFSQAYLEEIGKGIAQLLPGGRQAMKTYRGIKALKEGGVITGSGENRRLQYAIDMSPMNFFRATVAGPYSTPEAKAYYAANSSGLTADQTKLWMELRDEGVNGFALYGLMMRMDDAMNYSDLPDAKDDETEADKAKRLQMKEEKRKAARAELLKQEGLTDGQRMRIYSEMVSSYNDDQIEKLISAGMKWKDVSDILDKRGELSAGKSSTEWAAEFANWVDKKGYSDSRKEAIQEAFGSDSASFYNKMSAAGVSPDNALKVEKQARKLAGENDLNQKYKAQAIAESNLTDKEAYAALSAVYTSSGETLTAAQEAGIPGTVYAEFRAKESELSADKDENGKTISDSKKEKVIDLIDSLNLTAEQKDFMMEQQYKSFKWWQMPWN